MTYKLCRCERTKEVLTDIIIRKSDNAVIPFDEDNKDYREYLEWVAEGNTAEAAEEYVITWDEIRATRDQILRDTDWTMTSGATVDQAQWAAYRQVIRDIPQTYKDKTPADVVWPTQPSTAGPNT
jgi:hypothetical protein|tara:strand:- start:15 stop:389 length:375 start_codon:yes stop_codon:yes gene_type:complete